MSDIMQSSTELREQVILTASKETSTIAPPPPSIKEEQVLFESSDMSVAAVKGCMSKMPAPVLKTVKVCLKFFLFPLSVLASIPFSRVHDTLQELIDSIGC